jgi:hypothetical protein
MSNVKVQMMNYERRSKELVLVFSLPSITSAAHQPQNKIAL